LLVERARTAPTTSDAAVLPSCPIRYADDFIVLVTSDGDPKETRVVAEIEKASLANELQRKLGLALSEEKTLVTPVTSTMRFLGHHIRVRELPHNQ
jgi:RNA-directed DNA polymerase